MSTFSSLTPRIQRKSLNKESNHFAHGHMNVLAVNLRRVPGGMKSWPKLIERCFQPLQNRRIGAVVLFTKSTVGMEGMQWQCHCISNPHADSPVPQSLLESLAVGAAKAAVR